MNMTLFHVHIQTGARVLGDGDTIRSSRSRQLIKRVYQRAA